MNLSQIKERLKDANTEEDPNGLNQHESGAKLDAGKPRLSLVFHGFARALRAVGEVGSFGAAKYTDNGWMDVQNGIERYNDALLRHELCAATGEFSDPDSGLPHLAHLAWNALAILELTLREMEEDLECNMNDIEQPLSWTETSSSTESDTPQSTSGTMSTRSTMPQYMWGNQEKYRNASLDDIAQIGSLD